MQSLVTGNTEQRIGDGEILIAVSAIALTAALIGVTILAIVRGDTVEVMFHPPIFIKIKVTRAQISGSG